MNLAQLTVPTIYDRPPRNGNRRIVTPGLGVAALLLVACGVIPVNFRDIRGRRNRAPRPSA